MLFISILAVGCRSSRSGATPDYSFPSSEAPARLPAYSFVPGKTAVLHNGKAIPPRNAPVHPLLHIVCKQWESTIRLVSVYRSLAPILIFSHSGLRTLSVIINCSRKSWSTVCIGVGGYCHHIFHDCGLYTLAYQIVFQAEPTARHIPHNFGSAHYRLPCHAPTTSFHVVCQRG